MYIIFRTCGFSRFPQKAAGAQASDWEDCATTGDTCHRIVSIQVKNCEMKRYYLHRFLLSYVIRSEVQEMGNPCDKIILHTYGLWCIAWIAVYLEEKLLCARYPSYFHSPFNNHAEYSAARFQMSVGSNDKSSRAMRPWCQKALEREDRLRPVGCPLNISSSAGPGVVQHVRIVN